MPTWTGNSNGDFLTGTNWDGDVAPAPGSAVVIDDGGLGNQPTLGAGDASNVDTVEVSAGSLTVDGNLSATTGVTVSGGTLTVGGAGSISGDVEVSGISTFRLNGSLTGNFSSFGGTSFLKTNSSGIGTVTISGGDVNVETFGETLDVGDLTVNGATFHLDNAIVSVDSLSGSGGTIRLTSANGQSVLLFGSDNSSTAYSGSITSDTSVTTLVKEGLSTTTLAGSFSGMGNVGVTGGTLVLSGFNTFQGYASVAASQLALTGNGSIASASEVMLSSGGVFDISNTNSGAAINSLSTDVGESGSVGMGGKTLTIAGQMGAMNATTFTGAAGADVLSITMAGALADFSLATVIFTDWTDGEDSISITGNASANVITGSNFTDVMVGGGGSDTITGDYGDSASGDTGDDTLVNLFVSTGTWDGGADNDTLDVSADSFDGSVFNLSAASFTLFGATFMNFENVISSQGSDILIGSSGINRLYGSGGNDLISGGAGGDVIDGGAGTGDTADYRTSASGQVSVSLLADTASGGHAAGDTLDGIENLMGSLTLRDVLIGDNAANKLEGFGGADSLRGEAGDDYLDGGAGGDALNGGAGANDWAVYRNSTVGQVSINLLTAVHSGGDAQGDTLFFIENLEGSLTKRDILIGNGSVNSIIGNGGVDSIRGEGGNDVIEGGDGGDSLNAGAGIDTVVYAKSSAGVTVNLGVTLQTSGGEANGDSLFFFENITGSGFDDSLSGNIVSNRLVGGAGADALNGALGSDYLTGGLDGDTFRFQNMGFGSDTILDWEDGIDKISIALPLETSFAGLTFTGNGTANVVVRGFNGTGSAIIVKADVGFTLDAGDFVFV